MPDWRNLVRERLDPRKLRADDREEIIAELAAHLEETYSAAFSQGLNEEAATERALQEVKDWTVLSEKISHAKEESPSMNTRTKSLWLPAMATLLGANLFLMGLQRTAFQPRLVWIGHAAMPFYWPWFAGLPVFGALGAYLSLRAHGSVRARLAAALSPSLVLLAAMSIFLVWGLGVDGFSVSGFFYFVLAIANWVILQACALMVGAAPFLRQERNPRLA